MHVLFGKYKNNDLLLDITLFTIRSFSLMHQSTQRSTISPKSGPLHYGKAELMFPETKLTIFLQVSLIALCSFTVETISPNSLAPFPGGQTSLLVDLKERRNWPGQVLLLLLILGLCTLKNRQREAFCSRYSLFYLKVPKGEALQLVQSGSDKQRYSAPCAVHY